MGEHDVEKVWQEFWFPKLRTVKVNEITVDMEQIKRELFDYHQLRQQILRIEEARQEQERGDCLWQHS